VILDEIVAQKHRDVTIRATQTPQSVLEAKATNRSVTRSLWHALDLDGVGIIAEIKRRSPTGGTFAHNIDPAQWAIDYATAGASAVSVLTDEPYFGGTHDDLKKARAAMGIPTIQKDFVVTDYQLYEAAVVGADAVLLIAGITPGHELRHRIDLTHSLQMESLVEVHTDEEVDQALVAGAKIIGINNRNLRAFTTDLAVTEELCKLVPDEILVVSESGVHSPHDVQRVVNAGVDGILVGESIMTATDPIAQIKSLIAAGE
tara:strand:- start:2218 stop:2997 length:780 start_codon:yes stop_codon:yes gene_type:complete